MKSISYCQEQRLRMIEVLLLTYGWAGPQALTRYFGVGPACATRDFVAYRDMGGSAVYDPNKRHHVASTPFTPLFKGEPDAQN